MPWQAGAVAHQAAGHGIVTSFVDRRYFVARGQSRPASDRNRWPASHWNAWPASSESATLRGGLAVTEYFAIHFAVFTVLTLTLIY